MTNKINPSLPTFSLITAVTKDLGIGYLGDLPWVNTPIFGDMMYFDKMTRHSQPDNLFSSVNNEQGYKNVVIMGRKSWDSVPEKYRPFRNRWNIVVSRNLELELDVKDEALKKEAFVVHSLDEALVLSRKLSENGHIFVIGGNHLYSLAIEHPNCTNWFITELIQHPLLPCDTFFPNYQNLNLIKTNLTQLAHSWLKEFKSKREAPEIQMIENEACLAENGITYKFMLYRRN